jgi:hypothetical protein
VHVWQTRYSVLGFRGTRLVIRQRKQQRNGCNASYLWELNVSGEIPAKLRCLLRSRPLRNEPAGV